MADLHAVHHRQAILIAGGGVAALEAVLALRSLLGPTVKIELLAPDPEFVYRPISVAEPFGFGSVRRVELAAFAAEHSASYRTARLAAVDPARRIASTADGEALGYDFLIVAVGARAQEAIDGAICFASAGDGPGAVRSVLDDMQAGSVRRLVFAAPAGTTWLLPLYELALFTAAWARERDVAVDLTIATEEARALEVFGAVASDAVAGALADAGIRMLSGCTVDGFDGRRLLGPGLGLITADAVITLPRLLGPAIPGLPHDELGFIPINRHCAVKGCPGVYAAGDGVSFPIKQGGLAAQQADAAAEAIAAALGTVEKPRAFQPVLRGQLLTGGAPRYLRLARADGGELSEVSFRALWWPPGKIAGRHLSPYLQAPEDPDLMRESFADREGGEDDPLEAEQDLREATDLLLELAEANARRGSYRFALRCLEAAEEVSGPLSSSREADRRRWRDAVRAGG